jgi:hypothetical protein
LLNKSIYGSQQGNTNQPPGKLQEVEIESLA